MFFRNGASGGVYSGKAIPEKTATTTAKLKSGNLDRANKTIDKRISLLYRKLFIHTKRNADSVFDEFTETFLFAETFLHRASICPMCQSSAAAR